MNWQKIHLYSHQNWLMPGFPPRSASLTECLAAPCIMIIIIIGTNQFERILYCGGRSRASARDENVTEEEKGYLDRQRCKESGAERCVIMRAAETDRLLNNVSCTRRVSLLSAREPGKCDIKVCFLLLVEDVHP
jgi:hypothetical protein